MTKRQRYPKPPESVIDATYLAHCSPDAVWQWMQARDPRPNDTEAPRFWRAPLGRTVSEIVLLRRNHPLIDLALARFGSTPSVIRRVYNRGSAGVRCAALGSPFVGGGGGTRQSSRWMQEDDVLRLVASGWSSEFQAFCDNPFLGDRVYEDLLLRRNVFAALDDTSYAFGLRRLGQNRRLMTPYAVIYHDGWDEFSHGSVFEAAWSLAETLPAQEEWADVLYELLRNCVYPIRSRDVEFLLERWRIESPKEEQDTYGCPEIWLRTCLAGLMKVDESMLDSDDPAVKASYYRRFDPSKLPNWSERLLIDGAYFYESALRNAGIWRDPEQRETLRAVGWKLPDPHSDMQHPNAFLGNEARYHTLHPEWFATAPRPVG